MEKTRVALLADTQLYKTLYNLPELRNDWYDAFDQAFDSLLTQGDSLQAIAILGDVLDTELVGPCAIHCLLRNIQRVAELKIPVIILLGNHDKSAIQPAKDWAEVCKLISPFVHYLTFQNPLKIPATANLPALHIYGNSHLKRPQLEEQLKTLAPTDLTAENWLFLHQALKELSYHESAWELSATQVNAKFSRTFLGDFHDRNQYVDPQKRTFTYPGSIETVSFNQKEVPGFIIWNRLTNTYEVIKTQQRAYLTINLRAVKDTDWANHIQTVLSTNPFPKKLPVIRVQIPMGKYEQYQPHRTQLLEKSLKLFEDEMAEVTTDAAQPSVEFGVNSKDDVQALAMQMLKNDPQPHSQDALILLQNADQLADIRLKFPEISLKK